MSEPPLSYERDYEQVHAAIARAADRQDMLGRSELARFCASAQALAIIAVIKLADERSESVEAVLDYFDGAF